MITERLKQVVNWLIETGVVSSQRELADKMNYSASALSLRLTGKANITSKFIAALCNQDKHINKNWINTGEGNMILTEEDALQIEVETLEDLQLLLEENGMPFDVMNAKNISSRAKEIFKNRRKDAEDSGVTLIEDEKDCEILSLQKNLINVQGSQLKGLTHLINQTLPTIHKLSDSDIEQQDKAVLQEFIRGCRTLGL